ncbi:MAG: carboxypeptidase regulatory-like domain-containing protein [Gemmatimonas sp.]|nr:carboxypeptidase regulatory-like domain-containing protein [Gemmatimonas sp.]
MRTTGLSLVIGMFIAVRPGIAQSSATLSGRILDATTGAPVVAATIAVTTTGGSARTDSLGRYRLEGLKVGIHRFLVSAPGYSRGSVTLAFAAKERMERDLEIEPVAAPGTTGVVGADTARAQVLPKVPVTADAAPGRRFTDFERRRATGRGQYMTRAEMEAFNVYTLQDAMRNMRGVKFNCTGGVCRAQMVRAPLGCPPEYVVDERIDNTFGPVIPVRDIQALEVYTGVSDVPGEFAGRNSGCGVIVIWTTAGREPRRK